MQARGCAVIRQRHLIAVVGAFLIGCAVLLVGCSGVRSEASKQEEQARSHRCEGTRTYKRRFLKFFGGYTTNDVPDCPSGGLLSGTDGRDQLDGKDGDDEIHGLGDKDNLFGGLGSDVIYGGPGDDALSGGTVLEKPADGSKNVLHGGLGRDWLYGEKGDDVIYSGDGNDREIVGGNGEDVLYGGDGNAKINSAWASYDDGQADGRRDKIYCGEGKDRYAADKFDQVSSSCEKVWVPPHIEEGKL